MNLRKIAIYFLPFAAGVLIGFVAYRLSDRTLSAPTPTPQTTEPTAPAPAPVEKPKPTMTSTGCSPKAIEIVEPDVGAAVSFPFTLKAIVNNGAHPECRWTLFEAQAGTVVVKDAAGSVVARGILQTEEEWMTDAPVSFEAKVEALANTTPSGDLTIVVTEEDPSGQGNEETITIPVSVASLSDRCTLKPETGLCKAVFPKYFFDATDGTCKTFTWGGCGGVVPFEDLESCELACVSP